MGYRAGSCDYLIYCIGIHAVQSLALEVATVKFNII